MSNAAIIALACRKGISFQAARDLMAAPSDNPPPTTSNPPAPSGAGDRPAGASSDHGAASFLAASRKSRAYQSDLRETSRQPGEAARPKDSAVIVSREGRSFRTANPVRQTIPLDPHEPIGCRWIDGDPGHGPWSFCQAPTRDGRGDYCADHAARMYRKIDR